MTAIQNHDRHPEPWKGDYLPDLQIDINADGLIELEQQQGLQDPVTVEIHPAQVLYIAQMSGMVRELGQDEAAAREALQSRIRELERDQRRLRLALLACSDRAEQLFQDLVMQHERGHEDLGLEVAKAAALADILDLAKADFEDQFGVVGQSDGGRVSAPTTAQRDATRARQKYADSPRIPPATGEPRDLFGGQAGA